jgi:ubiquinone/menaquinone biosynthesis C-methylase UbiE
LLLELETKASMQKPALDYDRLARDYGANRRPNPDVLSMLQRIAVPYVNPLMLEVGAGTGNFATALTAAGAGVVIGIDPSREMLAHVRDGVVGRVAQALAEGLPFADRAFSVVYSVDVIHHIRDRDAAALEAFRVLAPGGTLVIVTDSKDDLAGRIPLTRYFPDTVQGELKRYPPIETVHEELRRAGFVGIVNEHVLTHGELTTIQPYRDKAFSSLLYISDEAFARGIARLETDLRKGPIKTQSPYTLVIARRPLS